MGYTSRTSYRSKYGNGTYKKKYTKGYSKQTLDRPRYVRQDVTNSKGQDQLRVYFNAFDNSTTNPKIPDGKTRLSTGIKLQAVKEFVNNQTGTMDILLTPGLQNGIQVINAANSGPTGNFHIDDQDPAVPTDDIVYQTAAYTNHVDFMEQPPEAPDAPSYLTQPAGSTAASWRVVSQACKLSLVNNSDENDGWFEAIRITSALEARDFLIARGSSKADETTNEVMPLVKMTNLSTANMVEHPTYISGKLRDIHNFEFHHMPTSNDHDFLRLRQSYAGSPEGHSSGVGTSSGYDLRDFMEHTVDPSYDMIYIRIHGRVNSTSDVQMTAQPTRLLAHTICNQEIVWDEKALQSRFQTEADSVPDFNKKKRAKTNGDTSAGHNKRRKHHHKWPRKH